MIETLAADDIDFERVRRAASSSWRDELESITLPPPRRARSGRGGDAERATRQRVADADRIDRGSSAPVFEQLLSQRLSALYEPLVLWWTEGSSIVEPSCLIAKGLPQPDTFGALLDGSWAQHRWRPVPAHVDTGATTRGRVVDDTAPVGFRSAAATDVGCVARDQRGRVRRTAGDRAVGAWPTGSAAIATARSPAAWSATRWPDSCRTRASTGRSRRARQRLHAGERAPAPRPDARRDARRSQRQHRRRAAGARHALRASSGPATAASIDGGPGRLERLTRDHSAGELEATVRSRATRNVVTRAVGVEPTLALDLLSRHACAPAIDSCSARTA